jgi:hypothetical protein
LRREKIATRQQAVSPWRSRHWAVSKPVST